MTTAELASKTVNIPATRHLIAGRYRAGNRIGHGRLGDIFEATDENLEGLGVEQPLAIQICPELVTCNNKLFNKLNLGFTMLRASAHPNIVTYRHFGRDGKNAFLLMDRLDGLSLRAVLDDVELLTPDEAKPVIRGIGEALRLLHAKDMLHANLTTRNVFITEDLEVRLLDVLPVDPAESILRGPVARGLFGPCTVADDVFGLACLSYEMLTGKHPFNHAPPAEARSSGFQVERIASLADSECGALRRALSLDVQQRTSSVAEFMRDFGIDGNERLRPTAGRPHSVESVDYATMEQAPPIMRPAAPARSTATTASVRATEAVPLVADRPPADRSKTKRSSPRRAILLTLLLASLGAWTYYGDAQDTVAAWSRNIEARLLAGAPDPGVQNVEVPTRAPLRPLPADADASDSRPAVGGEPPADAAAPQVDDESAPVAEDALADSAPPIEAAAGDDDAAYRGGDDPASGAESPLAADTASDETLTTSGSVFAAPVISVSERDGVARIAMPQTGYVESPLIWWTSEHTARAETDFVSIEQPLSAAPASEDGNVLLVPLVNDSLAEPPESFFVSLGSRDTRYGQIERIATVRVDIIDDD